MRGENGLFTLKGTEPRKLRSIMLTQFCWDKLQELAAKDNCSRSDLLEKWVADDTAALREEVAKLRSEKEELLSRVADSQRTGFQLADKVRADKNAAIEQSEQRAMNAEAELEAAKRFLEEMATRHAKIQQERDELDRECTQLHEKNGDLNLELDLLREKLQQAVENQPDSPAPQADRFREELAKIIELANSNTTGYTTKSFSRGLKKLKEIMTAE